MIDKAQKARELRGKRAEAIAAADAILEKAEAEDRAMNADEQKAFDGHKSTAVALMSRIETLESQAAMASDLGGADDGDVAGGGEGNGKGGAKAGPTAPQPIRRVRRMPPPLSGYLPIYRAMGGAEGRDAAYRDGIVGAAALGAGWARKRCEEEGIDLKATVFENVNATGGFFVPEETEARILELITQWGLFRRLADVYPMTSDTKRTPRDLGGITMYPVGENRGTGVTASDPTFDIVTTHAKEWQAKLAYSASFGEDATLDIGAWFMRKLAMKQAETEDNCGFIGDGTSTYHGIHGIAAKIDTSPYTASVVTALAGNTAFSTLDLEDFENVIGALPDYDGAQPAWFISKAGYAASMMRLMLASGGVTKGDIATGTPYEFLGFPVYIANKLNKTLTADVSKIKVLYGTLRQSSTMGIRRGLAVASNPYLYQEQGLIALYGSSRWDIVNHSLGSTTEAGPVIALKTPGA